MIGERDEAFEARLQRARVVPIISKGSVEDMLARAEVAADAGYELLEIALRSPAAVDAIRAVARAHPSVGILAGTVLDPDQVTVAAHAGVVAIVSPGLDPEVTSAARTHGIAHIPGVATATEITMAHRLGLRILKYFPAGGIDGLRALKLTVAPFLHVGVQLFPTGGLDDGCLGPFLSTPGVVALGGSWMLGSEGDATRTIELAKAASG